MSTKSSLEYYRYKIEKSLHIYNEMIDGKYYIEDEWGRVELPEKIAKEFSNVLKKYVKND